MSASECAEVPRNHSSSEYYLSEHAYVCVADGDLIVMDVRTGTYIGLTPMQSAALVRTVSGWPVNSAIYAITDALMLSGKDTLIDALLNKDLLTISTVAGKKATPISISSCSEEITSYFSDPLPRIRGLHILVFFRAFFATTIAMRLTSFSELIKSVHLRQRRQLDQHARLSDVAILLSIYNRIRTCVFTARDACFRDSLTLLHFLSSFGIYPDWIFAVQSAPFSAHCWVQYDTALLNDSLAHVRQFTPIFCA